MGHLFTQVLSCYHHEMPFTKVFKRFRVPCSLEKEITQNDPTTFINENTLHLMRLRLVEGAWIKINDGVRRLNDGESSFFPPFTNETLALLHSLHLKQDQHF